MMKENVTDRTEIEKCLYKLWKTICKINVSNKIGLGFLIKLNRGNNPFYCLMTDGHV